MDDIEFKDASKEDRGAMTFGRLKLTSNQIVFKNGKTGKVETLPGSEMETLMWHRLASDYCIRVMTKSGQMYRFGGFIESDYEKLNKFFSRNYSLELKQRDNCLRGWNWGTANFDGAVLGFDIRKNERAFEVPLMNVSHCTTAKNEVTLEFHHNDDAPTSLMEMRFHLPSIDGTDPVQSFLEQVLEKASIIQATGDAIATFKELQCLTPRGRYDIKIFPTFIQLHGKTFDYKIPISSVLRLFQLPHKDSRQVFFVMSLDPPIRQGQTRYHFLILLFNKDEDLLLELGVSDREISEKYDNKVQKQMTGPVYELVAKLMRVMVQRKITIPDPSFCSPKDVPVITCSYRASAGLLYPLDRGFIYVHKPPIHIRFDEILSINFARSGGSTRSFDFEVETKAGFVHTFSSIEKEEYSKLFDFVSKKKLRVKNRGTEGEKSRKDNDQDMIDSDLEDEPDAYLQRVREEGRIRTEVGDDSDESDESFNPDKESDDVAEEFDSNASASSSEESEEGDSSHKKKKKEKKEKHKKEKKPKEKRETKKKSKKDRDDNKPKRPQTAFFIWLNESREKIKKDNPGLSLTEVTKKAGEMWKEIKDKSKWEQKSQIAKKNYEKEMEEYRASGGPEKAAEKASKKSSSPKKSSNKSESKKSPQKSGSFKSKEYISDSDSSSDSDDDNKKKKKKKIKTKDNKTDKKSKKKDDSDAEMKSDAESEASASTPESSAEDSD